MYTLQKYHFLTIGEHLNIYFATLTFGWTWGTRDTTPLADIMIHSIRGTRVLKVRLNEMDPTFSTTANQVKTVAISLSRYFQITKLNFKEKKMMMMVTL